MAVTREFDRLMRLLKGLIAHWLQPIVFLFSKHYSLYLKDFYIGVSITLGMDEFQFIDMSKLTFRNNNCLAVFKKVEP